MMRGDAVLTKDEAVEAAAKYLAAVQQAICQVGYANSLPIENWQLVALRGVRVLPAAQAGNTTTTDHETGQLVSKGAQVRAFLEQAYRLSRDEKIQDGID